MKMRKWGRASVLILILLVVSVLTLPVEPANASWPNDPSVNTPICTEQGSQWSPHIISDGSGGAIITWYDNRSGNDDIYAQRVDVSGNTLWTENGVAVCNNVYDQDSANIAPDGSGGAIITWRDFRSCSCDIYAQRVNALGNTIWTDNGVVICNVSESLHDPRIVSDGSGGAIFTCSDFGAGDGEVYVQRVDGSGNTLWVTGGLLVSTGAAAALSPKLVSDGTGGAIITWSDRRGADDDTYAQRVDGSGNIMWKDGGVAVCTAGDNQIFPKIVSDGAGGAILTWWWNAGNFEDDIYAQRVDSAGNVMWTHNGVAICTAARQQAAPQLVSDGAGGAIITWSDNRYLNDIYAQRVDGSGNTLWTENGVAVCAAPGGEWFPRIVSDDAGGAIITWVDVEREDICAQRVDASGNALWETDGIVVCNAPDLQNRPRLTSDGSGGAIITWEDNRVGDDDIYAQRVDTNGLLAPPTTPQLWHLDSETTPAGYEMKKSSGNGDDCQTGSVNIGSGNSAIWLADQAAICDVAFPSGSWVAEIRTDSDWGTEGDKCEVAVGGWDTDTGWYEIPTMTATTVTWDCDFNIQTVLLQTESGTIYQGDYLALKIKNNDSGSHKVYTNGRSSLRSPDTDPGYPVPELGTGILFGLGLAGLLGYLGLMRRRC